MGRLWYIQLQLDGMIPWKREPHIRCVDFAERSRFQVNTTKPNHKGQGLEEQ